MSSAETYTEINPLSEEDLSNIEEYLLEQLNISETSVFAEAFKDFPEEYKITLASAISFFLSKPEHQAESEQERIKRLFMLFFKGISQNDIYFDSEKKSIKTRKKEKHKVTGESRSKLEHILLTGRIGHETATYYLKDGENKETKQKLQDALDTLGYEDFSSILLLVGFFHDFIEDFIEHYKKIYKKSPSFGESPAIQLIKDNLSKFNFRHLEKFIIPITRILTHNKNISSEEYLENIKTPDESMFEGYEKDLTTKKKEAIQTIAQHIKFMGDFAHNLKSEQSDNVFDTKFPVYFPSLLTTYPDFYEINENRLHPSVKRIVKILSKTIQNLLKKNSTQE